jgi:hypothetical protein
MTNGTGNESANFDRDLCSIAEERLDTAVVSDAMDQIGVRNRAMREYLRPNARRHRVVRLDTDQMETIFQRNSLELLEIEV